MLPLWSDAETGVQVARLTESMEKDALIGLFEGVAAREGWQPEGALRNWRERSVYFALEVKDDLAGGLQLVLPDEEGTLPCHALWPETRLSASSRSVHVGILALEEPFRGESALFWRLAVEMWRYCVLERITTLWLEVTPRVLPLYRRLGWALTIVGEARLHWGEDCYLCTLDIPEVAETILRRAETSRLYRQVVAQAFRFALPETETFAAREATLSSVP